MFTIFQKTISTDMQLADFECAVLIIMEIEKGISFLPNMVNINSLSNVNNFHNLYEVFNIQENCTTNVLLYLSQIPLL